MVVNLGAYATEIVRAGIQATPKGQLEAAQSLALSERQIFLRRFTPSASTHLASIGQSNCDRHARISRVWANLHRGVELCGQCDSESKFSRI
jgi:hypothetical protein